MTYLIKILFLFSQLQAILKALKPESEWGPALEKHRNASFLPGVSPQEKLDSIAQWVAKGTAAQTLFSITRKFNCSIETLTSNYI